MVNFEIAIDFVLSGEGGFVDDVDDDGGATNYGISFGLLKDVPMEEMKKFNMIYVDDDHLRQIIRDMSLQTAKSIYRAKFWDHTALEKINNQNLVNTYLDCAVMSGMANATRFVQRAICAYVGEYNFLIDDGVCGNKTIDKINFYGDLVIPSVRSERANYYREIVRHNPSKEKFLKGWLRRAYK